MADEDDHEQFIEWLRTSGTFVPESEELMPLIKAGYRPEDARLLTGIPFTSITLEELAALKHMDVRDLAPSLDRLARRGLVFKSDEGGKTLYRLNSLRFSFLRSFFWPGREDGYTRSVAPHVSRYYSDGFGDHWKDVRTKGLRVVPIRRTVDDPRRILPYEDVRELLMQQDRFAVAHCACRHRARMDGSASACMHETENCLHFGKLADYIIKNELGRRITKDESEEILARSAEAGLVHAVSNWRTDVDTICNCCRCCCVYFQGFHVLKHTSPMNCSGYQIHTNPETCQGCGLCVKRCPMNALQLESHPAAKNKSGKVSISRSDLCIGCGVCAQTCPAESLMLKPRSQVSEPPRDVDHLKRRYAEELAAARTSRGESVPAEPCFADVSSGNLAKDPDRSEC
jgi:electron transport complex protein RnfB